MERDSDSMVELGHDADAAPSQVLSVSLLLSLRDFDRLVEAAGVLVGRDQSALHAQPDVEFFRERLASSRALLSALHKQQWRLRLTRWQR